MKTSSRDVNQWVRSVIGVMENIIIGKRGLQRLMQSLIGSKAAGPDGQSNNMLKLVVKTLAPDLRNIFDKSLHNSGIPEN